ncbi:LysR family transcriptional regulator [Thioclava sp. GXIMD2076]|uniref:LysR family transcriptional regulator n=1 Tax=Thioclava kandeliae TaxID=3070818 RepID=A0ABV1SL48_9RHOB
MSDITLRQIEVIRAVMLRGTIQGAAEHLNVSAPGISRLIKHTEETLGLRLFERRAGLFVPSVEAQAVFDQIRTVYKDVANLQLALDSLKKGENVALAFGSAPSVAQFVAPRAIRDVRKRFPDLYVDLNILKIEETVDYLLLERGEFVIMSSRVDNPGVETEEVGQAALICALPAEHPLAAQEVISIETLAREPLIGIDPADPYGEILMRPFRAAGIEIRQSLRGRFSQTVIGLVRQGLGVAVVDRFSVADDWLPGIVLRPLETRHSIHIYAVRKQGRVLSSFAEYTIARFRKELALAAQMPLCRES